MFWRENKDNLSIGAKLFPNKDTNVQADKPVNRQKDGQRKSLKN